MAEWIKTTEAQKRLGISRNSFAEFKKKGYFLVKDGKVDFEKVKPAYEAIRKAKSQTEETLQTGADVIGYHKAKAVKTAYEAKLKELEYKELDGTLMNVEKAQQAVFGAVRQLRNSFLALPDRLAAVLAPETDKAKIHDILSREVRLILEDLVIRFTG